MGQQQRQRHITSISGGATSCSKFREGSLPKVAITLREHQVFPEPPEQGGVEMLRLLCWRSQPCDCLIELGCAIEITEVAAVVRPPEEFERKQKSPRARAPSSQQGPLAWTLP